MLSFKSLVLSHGQGESAHSTPADLLTGTHQVSDVVELRRLLGSRITRFREEIPGPAYDNRVCPAVLADKRWVMFTVTDYAKSDVLDAVRQECIRLGASRDLPTFIVSQTLLLNVKKSFGATQNSVSGAGQDRSAYQESFYEMVAWGFKHNASDMTINVNKFSENSQVHFTIDGKYLAPSRWVVPTLRLKEIIQTAWQSVKGGGSSVFPTDRDTQGSIEMEVDQQPVMLRWAAFAADKGSSVTLRLLKLNQQGDYMSFEDQGWLPTQVAALTRAMHSEGGAIVFAGVVGSGKTTALQSTLRQIPAWRKIVTLEDPVEYIIPNAIQNTITRDLEAENDTAYWAKLKTILRSAGNDVMLSEIRDMISGKAFVALGGSGTNIYTTVHAQRHYQIPERLASEAIGIKLDFLASPKLLKLLVYQALLPKVCTHCRLPIKSLTITGGVDYHGHQRAPSYWQDYIDRITRLFGLDASGLFIRNPDGCEHCQRLDLPELNGYKGREVVAELLEPQIHPDYMEALSDGDTLRMKRIIDELPRSAINDPDMSNKTIVECAMFKAYQGVFDPRDVEIRTDDFETQELIALNSARVKS